MTLMNRRQSLRHLSALSVPALFSSCSEVANLSRLALASQYLVDSNSMLSKMLPYFPFNQSYSGVGQVSLSEPVVSMIPDQNKIRLGLTANAGIAEGVAGQPGLGFLRNLGGQSTSGTCQLACGLRFNPEDNGIYLKDPVVEKLDFQNLSQSYTQPARNLLNLVGPQILDRYPIHTLKPSFATRAIQAMTVQQQGLLLDFGA